MNILTSYIDIKYSILTSSDILQAISSGFPAVAFFPGELMLKTAFRPITTCEKDRENSSKMSERKMAKNRLETSSRSLEHAYMDDF